MGVRMNRCPECGKAMATAAGLEIHGQFAHAAPAAPPEALPSAPPVFGVEPVPAPAPAAPPVARPTRHPAPSALFAGLGASAPVTALLIVVMFVAGLGTAVTRASSTHHATVTASAAPDATAPSSALPGDD